MRCNWYYDGKRFKNGNLNIRFSPNDIRLIESGKVSDVEVLSWKLEDFDCFFIGESYCTSNYTMGATIYNCYDDRVYRFEFGEMDDLIKGRTVKLYALIPDETDRKILEAEEIY